PDARGRKRGLVNSETPNQASLITTRRPSAASPSSREPPPFRIFPVRLCGHRPSLTLYASRPPAWPREQAWRYYEDSGFCARILGLCLIAASACSSSARDRRPTGREQ